MTRFMDIKCVTPKLEQSEIAKDKGCSSSTLRLYRHAIAMQSP